MATNSILAKTAKGIAAKPGDQGLNYDGVRLLRQVNGKACIAELRANFADLTDARFEKALVALQRAGLVRVLEVAAPAPVTQTETPGLDAQMHEVEQEVLQTLDFSSLQSTLLNAMRASPAKTDASAPAALPMQPAAAQAISRPRTDTATDTRTRPPPQERVTQEAELRARFMAALRPKVEEELRATLASALRPALEAGIRSKLIAALKPRAELELRTRLKTQREQAAKALVTMPLRIFECLPLPAFQSDLVGKNVCVNPAWTRLTGANVSDIAGKPLTDLFAEDDRKGVALHLDRIASGRDTSPCFGARLERWTGGPLRILLQAAPLTNAAGETTGVCGVLHVPDAVPQP